VKWGEKVVALIVRKSAELQEEDIEKFCLQSDELARYKRPRKVVFVQEAKQECFRKARAAQIEGTVSPSGGKRMRKI